MGKKESGGLGEKTQKGKGDCSCAAPPSLGLSPQDNGKTHKRPPSTQSIINPESNGRRGGKKKILQGMVKTEIMCYNRSMTRQGIKGGM